MLLLQGPNIYNSKAKYKLSVLGIGELITSFEICKSKSSFKIHEINSRAAYYTKALLVNEKVSSGEIQLIMGQ